MSPIAGSHKLAFYNAFNLLHITACWHGYFQGNQDDWNLPIIQDPFTRFFFVTAGDGYLLTRTGRIHLKPGHIYMIPFHFPCGYQCESWVEFFFIHLNLSYFGSYDLLDGIHQILTLPDHKNLGRALAGIEDQKRLNEFWDIKKEILYVLADFWSFFPDTISQRIARSLAYQDVFVYINKHLNIRLTCEEVASAASLPLTHMTKKFKTDNGCSLKQYIQKLLVSKAQALLISTTLPMQDIADELGFSDAYSFSSWFKKNTCQSPTSYRKRISF